MESLEDAFDRQDREAKASKLAQWREIQQFDPGLAGFMKQLNATFGKVALKQLKFLTTTENEK